MILKKTQWGQSKQIWTWNDDFKSGLRGAK